MEECVVISVWVVDPIGGSFVDWPEELKMERAVLHQAVKVRELLCSDEVSNHGLELLWEFGQQLPGAWISHEQLKAFRAELYAFGQIAEEVLDKYRMPEGIVSEWIDKLNEACEFATLVDEAGIHVG